MSSILERVREKWTEHKMEWGELPDNRWEWVVFNPLPWDEKSVGARSSDGRTCYPNGDWIPPLKERVLVSLCSRRSKTGNEYYIASPVSETGIRDAAGLDISKEVYSLECDNEDLRSALSSVSRENGELTESVHYLRDEVAFLKMIIQSNHIQMQNRGRSVLTRSELSDILKGASLSELLNPAKFKDAYRRIMMIAHPDKNGDLFGPVISMIFDEIVKAVNAAKPKN